MGKGAAVRACCLALHNALASGTYKHGGYHAFKISDPKPRDIHKATVRDRLVADTYSRFLDAALDEPAVKMVVTWGLSDRHSWIVRRETNESKWRKDAMLSRPLPFDADLQPKPACEAIAQAFTHAPHRPAG